MQVKLKLWYSLAKCLICPIKHGESLISVQQKVKYLNLNIDNKLNFKEHTKIIERKVAWASAHSTFLQNQSIIFLEIYHTIATLQLGSFHAKSKMACHHVSLNVDTVFVLELEEDHTE